MVFDFSHVGHAPADTAIPPALKAKGASSAEFARELSLTFGRGDADKAVREAREWPVEREQRNERVDDHRADRRVEDDEAIEEAAAARESERAARTDDAEGTEDDAPAETGSGKLTSTEDTADRGQPEGAQPADPLATQSADADGGPSTTPDGETATAPAQTDTGEGKTTAGPANAGKATRPEVAATPQDATRKPETAADKATGVAEQKTVALPDQAAAKAQAPVTDEELLAALQELLGPEAAAAVLEPGADAAAGELPGVHNMPEGVAALTGPQGALAHMLMKRIDALQHRLDRLQQLVKAQQNGAITSDAATALRPGATDGQNVGDIIAGLMRQTEARLDALMNGNARAAAQPQHLAADALRPGAAGTGTTSTSTGAGSFASQLSGDAATAGSQSSSSQSAAAQANAAMAARAAPAQTAAGIQVAIQLTRAAHDGLDRISIRLNPPELGRVDVKLEVGHDGRTLAVVTADRQETLDLLQRDARGLERALQDAGLKADSGSLSFNLRHQGQEGGQLANDGTPAGGAGTGAPAGDDDAVTADAETADPNRLLDISV